MYYYKEEHYSFVQISDEEYEVHDKVKYEVGEIVNVTSDVLKSSDVLNWDARLWHPNTKVEHLIEEHYVIFHKRTNNREPLRGNIHLRNFFYDVVKVDDPRIQYVDLTSEQIKKLSK